MTHAHTLTHTTHACTLTYLHAHADTHTRPMPMVSLQPLAGCSSTGTHCLRSVSRVIPLSSPSWPSLAPIPSSTPLPSLSHARPHLPLPPSSLLPLSAEMRVGSFMMAGQAAALGRKAGPQPRQPFTNNPEWQQLPHLRVYMCALDSPGDPGER